MKDVFKRIARGLWLLLIVACTTDQDLTRVAEARIRALQTKHLDQYLDGDYYYVGDIEKMEESQPKVIWQKETDRIKQKYKPRFDEAVNQTPVASSNSYGLNPSGIFLYKDIVWKVLEVRRSGSITTNDGRTLSSSRVFVQCEFKSRNQSPYDKYNYDPYNSPKYTPAGKPLKKVIVAFNVVTALSKPTIVDGIEVPEGREYWDAREH